MKRGLANAVSIPIYYPIFVHYLIFIYYPIFIYKAVFLLTEVFPLLFHLMKPASYRAMVNKTTVKNVCSAVQYQPQHVVAYGF